MVDRLLWIALVIFCAMVASLLGAFLRLWLTPRRKCPRCGAPFGKFNMDIDDVDAVRHCEKCGCAVDANGRKVKKRNAERENGSAKRDKKSKNAAPASSALPYWLIGCGVLGGLLLLGLAGMSIVILIVQAISDAGPPGPGDHFPPIAKKEILVDPEPENLGPKEAQTPIQGGAFDPTFRDEAPRDGLLIGMDVGLGKFLNLDVVKALQPIYGTPHGEVAGRKFGTDFSNVISVKAKPGFAVGAINVKAGLLVNGFSVTFMRIKGAGLDPADAYTTAWIGDMTGGNGPIVLGGDGTPIIGVIGRRNARDCNGLGLLKKR